MEGRGPGVGRRRVLGHELVIVVWTEIGWCLRTRSVVSGRDEFIGVIVPSVRGLISQDMDPNEPVAKTL